MQDVATESFDPWLPNQDLLRIFDWKEVFGNENPVEIDLGAGDGSFALGYAKLHPGINLVATERLLGRVRKIAKRAVRENAPNVRALRLESYYFIRRMCAENSLNRVHVMFPDPWPKRKHFKYRLIQPEFVHAVHRALKMGGEMRFTTDHEEYFQWSCKVWNSQPGWTAADVWDYSQDPKTDFQSDFDKEGRSTHRARWIKSGPIPQSLLDLKHEDIAGDLDSGEIHDEA